MHVSLIFLVALPFVGSLLAALLPAWGARSQAMRQLLATGWMDITRTPVVFDGQPLAAPLQLTDQDNFIEG